WLPARRLPSRQGPRRQCARGPKLIWGLSWRAGLARFGAVRTCADVFSETTTPARGGRYPFISGPNEFSAVVGAGCNARDVRAIKADIGQFAIAELGQFADIALIVPERLDHADEREQHW